MAFLLQLRVFHLQSVAYLGQFVKGEQVEIVLVVGFIGLVLLMPAGVVHDALLLVVAVDGCEYLDVVQPADGYFGVAVQVDVVLSEKVRQFLDEPSDSPPDDVCRQDCNVNAFHDGLYINLVVVQCMDTRCPRRSLLSCPNRRSCRGRRIGCSP